MEPNAITAGVNPGAAAPSATPLPCDPHRLLIVDDESAIRTVFQRVVAAGIPNCHTDVAVNGAEAVEYFRSARQAVVLMDLQMPVMNGEQAFREIQKLCKAENWELPAFIFCTGFEPPRGLKDIVTPESKHCLLRKPVTIDTLLNALRQRLPA